MNLKFLFFSFLFLMPLNALYASNEHSINEAIDIIKNQYLDDISDKKISESAISGILSSLDPYSEFLNQEEYEEIKSATKGEFAGIGIEVKAENGLLKIITVYKNLPGYNAGLKPGDIIVMINNQQLSNLTIPQAINKLKGEPKSKLRLKIYRENEGIKEVMMLREIIKLIPTKAKYFKEDKIIYIKISSFTEQTYGVVRQKTQEITKHHPDFQGVIIDLRDNLGGIFEQAVQVTKLFLNNGKIVSIKGRYGKEIVYEAEGEEIIKDVPIIVLINHATASGAEIVASALQDNKRAFLIGQKSFCKGLIQNIIPFVNGTAIKLTTAKFYTPSGNSIQEKCVIPDVIIKESPQKDLNKITIPTSMNSRIEKSSTNNINAFKIPGYSKDEINDNLITQAINFIKIMSFIKSQEDTQQSDAE